MEIKLIKEDILFKSVISLKGREGGWHDKIWILNVPHGKDLGCDQLKNFALVVHLQVVLLVIGAAQSQFLVPEFDPKKRWEVNPRPI